MTDFFAQQEIAHKKTGRLILLYAFAVAAMIIAVYAVSIGFTFVMPKIGSPTPWGPFRLFQPRLLIAVAVGTTTIISLGSLYKILQLRDGGRVIAESLGGRLLATNTTNPADRVVLNVVEEMAIASGTPVPPVYLLDAERSINAFAAGFAPEDAVIGISRGCCDNLTRDQLQGVVAHEFSHVLNGDMRLNIRLVGIVHGILLIGLLGDTAMRTGMENTPRTGSHRHNALAPLVFLGFVFVVLGYTGTFFGRLIKAAVSRQREFLADASAVQFTRNPDGIAGALKVIASDSGFSSIYAPQAEVCSHMFFGNAKKCITLFGLLATHPPISERIERIDKSAADDIDDNPSYAHYARDEGTVISQLSPHQQLSPSTQARPVWRPRSRITPESVVNAVGTADSYNLHYASELLASIPFQLKEAARDPYNARALVYALLLNDDDDVRAQQLAGLSNNAAPEIGDHAERYRLPLQHAGRAAYMPLVDLAIPALKQLAPLQYERFRQNVRALVSADGFVDLFEYALEHMLVRNLDRQFRRNTRPSRAKFYSLKPFANQLALLLSAIARTGSKEEVSAVKAYRAGVAELGDTVDDLPVRILPGSQITLDAIDQTLTDLNQVSFREKRRVIGAAAATVAIDGEITVAEAELLRAVADALSCPLPPLLAVS